MGPSCGFWSCLPMLPGSASRIEFSPVSTNASGRGFTSSMGKCAVFVLVSRGQASLYDTSSLAVLACKHATSSVDHGFFYGHGALGLQSRLLAVYAGGMGSIPRRTSRKQRSVSKSQCATRGRCQKRMQKCILNVSLANDLPLMVLNSRFARHGPPAPAKQAMNGEVFHHLTKLSPWSSNMTATPCGFMNQCFLVIFISGVGDRSRPTLSNGHVRSRWSRISS